MGLGQNSTVQQEVNKYSNATQPWSMGMFLPFKSPFWIWLIQWDVEFNVTEWKDKTVQIRLNFLLQMDWLFLCLFRN